MNEWRKKRRGNAIIWLHPASFEGRAIVVNPWGIFFNGEKFQSLELAKEIALSTNGF